MKDKKTITKSPYIRGLMTSLIRYLKIKNAGTDIESYLRRIKKFVHFPNNNKFLHRFKQKNKLSFLIKNACNVTSTKIVEPNRSKCLTSLYWKPKRFLRAKLAQLLTRRNFFHRKMTICQVFVRTIFARTVFARKIFSSIFHCKHATNTQVENS